MKNVYNRLSIICKGLIVKKFIRFDNQRVMLEGDNQRKIKVPSKIPETGEVIQCV